MFIGHFGVGFAAKKPGEYVSLGTLFLAAQFIDLLWPLLLLFGIERVRIDTAHEGLTPLDFTYYPYSHSLFWVLVWAVAFGLVYFFIRKRMKPALLLSALVVSHWLLDLIVHRPDLPLLPWLDVKVGFGLWNFTVASVVVESLIFLGGVALYLATTRALNRTGTVSLWCLIAFLALVHAANLFGPPPDAVRPIAIVGLAQWLLVAWGYWIDRNRKVRI